MNASHICLLMYAHTHTHTRKLIWFPRLDNNRNSKFNTPYVCEWGGVPSRWRSFILHVERFLKTFSHCRMCDDISLMGWENVQKFFPLLCWQYTIRFVLNHFRREVLFNKSHFYDVVVMCKLCTHLSERLISTYWTVTHNHPKKNKTN